MELESLFGLPAHPLLVHAAVVLVPLAAVGTVAIAVWGAARRRIGWIVVALGFVAFGSALLAQSSGESLEEDDRAGSIAIHVEAPQSLAVQASLTASGPGFSADGSREILLFGSLCAAGLDIGGTQVVLIPDRRFAGEPSLLRDAPRTAVPVLSAVSLQVREWR